VDDGAWLPYKARRRVNLEESKYPHLPWSAVFNILSVRDLEASWRKARDWRNQTGNGVDGTPGGATIIWATENEGSKLSMLNAEADLEGTSFMLHL